MVQGLEKYYAQQNSWIMYRIPFSSFKGKVNASLLSIYQEEMVIA